MSRLSINEKLFSAFFLQHFAKSQSPHDKTAQSRNNIRQRQPQTKPKSRIQKANLPHEIIGQVGIIPNPQRKNLINNNARQKLQSRYHRHRRQAFKNQAFVGKAQIEKIYDKKA